MRENLQPAFILHRRPYRDTSLLLEILSRDHGRVGLIARGARGAKSRSKGLLQPLTPLLLSWSGKGELPSLSASEASAPPLPLAGERLLCGLYLNELLLRLLARFDPQPQLFGAYRDTLSELATPECRVAATLRLFEKHLLDTLGYGLSLTRTADTGQPVQPDRRYQYHLDRGLIEVPAHRGAGAGVEDSDSLVSTCCGATLLALAAGQLDDPIAEREARLLLRQALDDQLDGKPLQTRKLLNDYRRRRL